MQDSSQIHVAISAPPRKSAPIKYEPGWSPEPVWTLWRNTGLSKKVDGILNRYNLKSTGRIYTFGILKCSEKFKVLDLP